MAVGDISITFAPVARLDVVVCSIFKQKKKHKGEKPIATLTQNKPGGGWPASLTLTFAGAMLKNQKLMAGNRYLVTVEGVKDNGKILTTSRMRGLKRNNSP